MTPWLVRNLIYPVHEHAFGRRTFESLSALEGLQWAPPEKLEALRLAKLKALLRHARDNIPFYRERFANAGFDPEQVESLADLSVLPPLTKSEIKANLDRMLWRECPGGLVRYNTGGSTGEPLVFYFDKRRQAWDKAARMLTHRWFAHDVGDRELYLWGSPVELSKQDRLKRLRDTLMNERLLNAHDLSGERLGSFYSAMVRFSPRSVFGYPSSISLFCEMCARQGHDLSILGVKAVFTTAEVLYEHQRRIIGDSFGGIPVADSYGSREGGFVCQQCPEGKYHVMDPNYILELLTPDGPARPEEDGEIVLTHLDAWGMPFIRYRTGDMARAGQGRCACGRTFSTLRDIRGRATDFVVTPDGRWQHSSSLTYVIRSIEGIEQFKILQEAVDDVRVLIKPTPAYPRDGDERMRDGFRRSMGREVRVTVSHVPDIPRDASGKYRYVVSKVSAGGFR